ncbi:MAG: six-hairpin glycosidase, partial [Sphingobacterium siyangense]
LQIELVNDSGLAAARIIMDKDGIIKNKAGYRNASLTKYEMGKMYHFALTFDVSTRSYQVAINGEDKGTKLFFQPASNVSKVSFRTGDVRRFPNADTETDQDFDVENAGASVKEATYQITSLKAQKLK